jgi:hypothetical protein
MSFDLFFLPSRKDCPERLLVNPMTKREDSVRVLSKEDLESVRASLSTHRLNPEPDGSYRLTTRDGGSGEVFLSPDSCMVSLRGVGLTPGVAAMLFALLQAGRWILFSASGEGVLAASLEHAEVLPDDSGTVRLVHSP